MVRKPPNVSWGLGFSEEQAKLLDYLDQLGNNAWARTDQTEVMMPNLLDDCEKAGLTVAHVKEAMKSVGYGEHALHELDRWSRSAPQEDSGADAQNSQITYQYLSPPLPETINWAHTARISALSECSSHPPRTSEPPAVTGGPQ